MKHQDLEEIYAALAQKLDEVGGDKGEIYLAKLTLLLAEKVGDTAPVLKAIDDAALSLKA